jgi:hypothetical protein
MLRALSGSAGWSAGIDFLDNDRIRVAVVDLGAPPITRTA